MLTKVHRKACLGITGAMKSTLHAALEVIIDIIDIELHLRSLSIESVFMLMSIE